MTAPIRNYCSLYRRETNHKVLHTKKIRSDEDDYASQESFLIVEYLGCENVSFRKEYSDQDMVYHDDTTGEAEYYTDVKNYPFYLDGHIPLAYTHLLPASIK